MAETEKKSWKRLSGRQIGVFFGYPAALLAAIIVINERDPSRLRNGIAVFTAVYALCAVAILWVLRWWNGPDR